MQTQSAVLKIRQTEESDLTFVISTENDQEKYGDSSIMVRC